MTTNIKTNNKYTEQHVLNSSFDEDYDVLVVELLAHDSTIGALRRVSMDALNHYATSDLDNTNPNEFYEGLMDSEGNWQIVQITTTGTLTANRFATVKNNNTYTSYADAWADHTLLDYDYYSVAF
jgi:hypothetical protein